MNCNDVFLRFRLRPRPMAPSSAGVLCPSRGSLRRSNRHDEPRAVGQTGPRPFLMPCRHPRAVDPPDAPEASNWIRGSFDSSARIRPATYRTARPPGVTPVTATLGRTTEDRPDGRPHRGRPDRRGGRAGAPRRARDQRGSWSAERKPVTAIADVSLRLERGDIVGILGANGSGKFDAHPPRLGSPDPRRGQGRGLRARHRTRRDGGSSA